MLDIPREVTEHALKIRPGSKTVKQHLHHFDEEKCRSIGEEIAKLLAPEFIKEVYHPEWLANPVLVQKKSGEWRMCVDYTGLNKACPKDPFSLPRIDQVVNGDPTALHPHRTREALLSDIHGGVYGHHAAPRTLVRNAF